MRERQQNSGGASSRRVEILDDGVAIFDPVTWRTHVVTDDAHALIESIRDTIRSGVRELEPLLDALLVELGEPPTQPPLARHVQRENLRKWASLALHLERAPADE